MSPFTARSIGFSINSEIGFIELLTCSWNKEIFWYEYKSQQELENRRGVFFENEIYQRYFDIAPIYLESFQEVNVNGWYLRRTINLMRIGRTLDLLNEKQAEETVHKTHSVLS